VRWSASTLADTILELWRTWWWICFAGGIVFLPFIRLMTGRWSPSKARQDALAHSQAVDRELAALPGAIAGS
jgi:hypothetical protein